MGMIETYFDGENELTVIRNDGETYIDRNNEVIRYYLNDELHRADGPAVIWNVSEFDVYSESYVHYGQYYCIVSYNKSGHVQKKNFFDGDYETVYYFDRNGNIVAEKYLLNDNLHRTDGPALSFHTNNKNTYYVYGEEIDTEQFNIDFENWPLSIEEQTLLKMSL